MTELLDDISLRDRKDDVPEKKKKDLFICPKCEANLIEVGITEVTVGGVGKTDIYFGYEDGIEKSEKVADIQNTRVEDFDEQWVICLACGEELHDRTASQIVEAYEGDLPHEMDDEDDDEEDLNMNCVREISMNEGEGMCEYVTRLMEEATELPPVTGVFNGMRIMIFPAEIKVYHKEE